MRAIVGVWVLVSLGAGCGQGVTGRACVLGSTTCPSGWECAGPPGGPTHCEQDCSLSETVCHDGSFCIANGASPMGGVCYLGGTTPIGQPCTDNTDCVRTGICIRSAIGGQAACFVGCNIDGTHGCPNGGTCQPTTGTAGYCTS
jgi:hypothetical protein